MSITTTKVNHNEWNIFIDKTNVGILKKFASKSGFVKKNNWVSIEWWPNFDEDEIVELNAKTVRDAKLEVRGYYV